MTGCLFNRAIPGLCLSLTLTGWLSAQQVEPILDVRRSLQIPPQDILKVAGEPGKSVAEVPSVHRPPASQPSVGAVEAGPAAPVLINPSPSTRPAAALPETPGRESAPIARIATLERRATTSQRESESRDINRGLQSGNLWSARELWPLLSVLALIVILAWIVKRCLPNRRSLTSQGVIEVLSRTALSSKQSLVLVRMGRRLLLLGVTNDEMNTLCVVEDPDQVAMLVGEVASSRPGSITDQFARAFSEESEAYEKEAAEEEEESVDTGEPVRSLLDKVRCLTSRRNVA
ncbi:MAG: flagellar biosynthetic protein FliO [Planctomycetes bacterium]|nr:flagellar biosynthetic protein FliO [Planctomycetota bacterium]